MEEDKMKMDDDMIEIAEGEVFDHKGTALIVVADSEERYGCEYCYFHKTKYCFDYKCVLEFRKDETDVHFEKLKGGENEN